MRGYRNSLEHVLDALQRIDLLIHRHVLQFRLIHQRLPDEWRGLYLSDDDIATLVQKIPPHHETSPEVLAHLTALDTRLVELEAHIAMHKAASRRAGIVLRLERLQTLFRLTALDLDTLLLCLAPEFEAKYPKLYASLQDDVTRKYPTMRLALALLCPAVEARLAARAHFAPTAPLRAANLLQVCEASERQTPFLDRALQVDERLVDYVFDRGRHRGSPVVPGALGAFPGALAGHRATGGRENASGTVAAMV